MAMIPDPGAGDPERDERLAAAWRAVAQPQPPERLDDAIRAAARRAVAAGPRRGAERLRRWSIPLSLAAVVVLSVTLVTMMREEGADRWVSDAPPLPRVQPPGAMVDAPAPIPAPAPAQPTMQSMVPAPAMPARKAASPVAVAPAELQRSVPRTEMPAADAARAKATAGAAAPADTAAGVRQDSAPRDAAAPRSLLQAAPAAALAETTAAGAGRPAAAGSPGLGAMSSAKAPPARAAGTLWQDLEGEPAARWLDRLRELRKADRAADADRLAAEFRRRFPGAALPDDLR